MIGVSLMHIPKIRTVLRIPALVFVAFLAWVACQAFQPPPGSPNISVKLLGYTNDTSGTRLAMIAVTNLSAFKISIAQPRIEIPTQTRDTYTPSYLGRWHSVLRGGASGNFTIPPPTNQPTWKLSFLVYNDVGSAQVIQRTVAAWIFGVTRHMPSRIESNWIEAEK
jgi:hypothetical protein